MKLFFGITLPLLCRSMFCNTSIGYFPIWENQQSDIASRTIHLQNAWVNQTFSNHGSYMFLRQVYLQATPCSVNKSIGFTVVDLTDRKDVFYSILPIKTSVVNQSYIEFDFWGISILPNHRYSLSLFANDNMCVNISQQPVSSYNSSIGTQNETMYIQNLISTDQLIGSICLQSVPTQCSCRHGGVNCISNCSYNFCLCTEYGKGYIMNTSLGTVCYNDIQVWPTDERCQNPETNVPHPTATASPLAQFTPSTRGHACQCASSGVSCVQECATEFCLCGQNLQGVIFNTSEGTVCSSGHQVWMTDPTCTNNEAVDGLYCSYECSITYYSYSNGIRSPDQFTPSGTVCTSNDTFGSLVYPHECGNILSFAVSLDESGWICVHTGDICSDQIYYAENGYGYALQSTPSGLVCYNNTLILSSSSYCIQVDPSSTPIGFSLRIDPHADPSYSTLLGQMDLASSISDSLLSVGVPIPSNRILFTSIGRRLASHIVTVTVYTPKDYVTTIGSSFQTIVKIQNTQSILSNALAFKHHTWNVISNPPPTSVSPPHSLLYDHLPLFIGVFTVSCVFVLIGATFILYKPCSKLFLTVEKE